jgi:hypothetical protein
LLILHPEERGDRYLWSILHFSKLHSITAQRLGYTQKMFQVLYKDSVITSSERRWNEDVKYVKAFGRTSVTDVVIHTKCVIFHIFNIKQLCITFKLTNVKI